MMENNILVFEASAPLSGLDPISKVLVSKTKRGENGWEWIEVTAKWDTGATMCAITRNLCNRLGLKAEKTVPVRCFSNPEGRETPYSAVLLKIVKGPYAILAVANVMDTPPVDCDMIIGMNVIASGKFSLTVNGSDLEIRLEVSPDFERLKKLKHYE